MGDCLATSACWLRWVLWCRRRHGRCQQRCQQPAVENICCLHKMQAAQTASAPKKQLLRAYCGAGDGMRGASSGVSSQQWKAFAACTSRKLLRPHPPRKGSY